MNQMSFYYTNDMRSKQIADLEKENQWLKPFGYALYLYEFSRFFNRNYNIQIDEFSFHNGMKYVENWWKLCVLYNNDIPEQKKDLIMKDYECSLKAVGEILKDDLKSHGLLVNNLQSFNIPQFH